MLLAIVELSLFQATFLFALFLLAAGGSLLLKYHPVSALARRFPRSNRAGTALMVAALVWTAWKVSRLGAADYGDFRQYILIVFGLLGALSFKYASDFLSVRAVAVLYLFAADMLLDGAWMRYEEPLRLFMVVPVYLGIVLALYLAYAPFRLRDFFAWLFQFEARAKRFAMGLAAYGLVLGALAFAY